MNAVWCTHTVSRGIDYRPNKYDMQLTVSRGIEYRHKKDDVQHTVSRGIDRL